MFPHLRIWLLTLWTSSIAGAVVITGLTLGHYHWSTFLWAALIGLVIGVPAALLNWAYLRPNRSREVGLNGTGPARSGALRLLPPSLTSCSLANTLGGFGGRSAPDARGGGALPDERAAKVRYSPKAAPAP
jgi:hypothetical protein